MSRVLLNGISINYRQVGHGRDVVLIHGIAANHAFWRLDFLLPLARSFRVTVFDLRGHGYSSMPPSGYTPREMANDLRALLDHLGIEAADLIGHSFGGVVALQLAARHPERVRRLVVADSRIRPLQPRQMPQDLPDWETARRRLEEVGLALPEDEPEPGIWLLEQLARPEWRDKRHLLEGTSIYVPFSRLGGGNRSAEKWLELLHRTNARSELREFGDLTVDVLRELKHPTLAVFGERSSALPSGHALREHLPRSRLRVIQNAAHFFPATQPTLFLEAVMEFFEEPCRTSPAQEVDLASAGEPAEGGR